MNIEKMVEINNTLHALLSEVTSIKNLMNNTNVFSQLHPTIIEKMAVYEAKVQALLSELKEADVGKAEEIIAKHGSAFKEYFNGRK